DWSSDVYSSDLSLPSARRGGGPLAPVRYASRATATRSPPPGSPTPQSPSPRRGCSASPASRRSRRCSTTTRRGTRCSASTTWSPSAPCMRCDYVARSEEHTSELQSRENLVYRLLLE